MEVNVALKFYNTMSGKLDEFHPGGRENSSIEEYPPVSIYSCGPTVYGFAHIGNFRTFIFNDLLRRYLTFRGYTVNHAMNITDVDDKTIAGAAAEGISLTDYTQRYTEVFFEDLATLNIEPVEHNPRATESIDAMADIITRLDAKDLIYNRDGSVYFSIKNFKQYGRLSRLEAREIKSGARYDADEYEKDDVRDFALWKAPKEGEVSWTIPAGEGRPGWHIECSAMIERIFHDTIDIHTGGVDLIFPHHENEIAQSEAAFERPFVRYWLHVEHLLVEGKKMSKSAGNFYTLRDLLEMGHSPRTIRFLLLTSHYRKQLNFTFDGLGQAEAALSRIDSFLLRLKDIHRPGPLSLEVKERIASLLSSFTEKMDDDLNISGGLGVFFDFIHDINGRISEETILQGDAEAILEAVENLDQVFGFINFPEDDEIDAEGVESLIKERNKARKNRNFARADEIRDQLKAEGIVLEDSPEGTRWRKERA